MRFYRRELIRLNSVFSVINSKFTHFGVNKKQEISRLLYEIAKREKIHPGRIIKEDWPNSYDLLKKSLLRRRYPHAFINENNISPYFSKIERKKRECANLAQKKFSPKHIFIEKSVSRSNLAERMHSCFPGANFTEIDSYKSYKCLHRGFDIQEYNRRRDKLFIVKEEQDFFKKCPCTKSAVSCGYHIFNLGFGCIFECTYCYLQAYANSPGIILPANIESYFDKFPSHLSRSLRIGTGEFSDSLALDELTEYSLPIISFFKNKKNVTFEFKTKSKEIDNLLKIKHGGNIVISWSLNPQSVIEENEFFSVPLHDRIEAACKCIRAGYKVGFHLDPIIYFSGWYRHYSWLIESLFERIKPKDIAWVSLGTLRFNPVLKSVIEKRFPQNDILDEELLLGFDGKLRYPIGIRQEIYNRILRKIFGHSRSLKVYLCMETKQMQNSLFGNIKIKNKRYES